MVVVFGEGHGKRHYKAKQNNRKHNKDVILYQSEHTDSGNKWKKLAVLPVDEELSLGQLLHLCRNHLHKTEVEA